jgi:hypothetical protein
MEINPNLVELFLQAHAILEHLDQESQALWTHLQLFLDMRIIREILCKKGIQIEHFSSTNEHCLEKKRCYLYQKFL